MDSVNITIKNNKICKIESQDEKIIKNISKLLSYKQSGVEFTQAYKNGWDGVTRLMNKKNEFGIGLLDKVKNYLDLNQINFIIDDKRKNEKQNKSINLKLKDLNITPRDYQNRCLDATIENDRGIIRAATGSGKCNSVDSINLTEFGMLNYKELLELNNISSLNDGYACQLNMSVSTPLNNGSDMTSMIYHDGYTLSKKITTKYGYSLTGTLDHKIKVIDSNGDFIWKRMEDITKEDYAVISYNNQMFGKEYMSNDDAYWLGFSINKKDSISKNIRMLDKKSLSFFIKGIYDSNGTIDSHKRNIEIKSINEKIIDQLQLILLNFGIVSEKINYNKSYKLVVNNNFYKLFLNEFILNKKNDKSIKYIYLKIEKIEDVMSDNYDFSIPKTHSFISQGFINHNTLIAAQMTAHFNKPTIIYVIGLDLLQQFHDLFSKLFDEEIGWIGNGRIDPKRITIASVWTLGSALDLKGNIFVEDDIVKELPVNIQDKIKVLKCLKEANIHIIDECHVCTCDTLQQIYKYINPERIYGLSGTPFRDDGSDMITESMLGPIINNVDATELIEKKVLAQPIIKFVNVPYNHSSSMLRTYQEIYRDYIVDNDIRNKIIVNQTKFLIEKKYVPLVLFKTIDHGKKLYNMFLEEGIRCDLLFGNDSLEKREQVKNKLNAGDIDCIVASTIFDIGVDLPKLSALVLAGSGKSRVRILQRIGRVIRKSSLYPKEKAAIVDFIDNVRMLDKHSKIRYETYIQEKGFKILGNGSTK